MKNDFLSRLFYASSEQGVPCDGRRINELYVLVPERFAAFDAIDNRLTTLGVPQDAICNELTYLVDIFERQGFINGFRFGMMLQEELTRGYPWQQNTRDTEGGAE